MSVFLFSGLGMAAARPAYAAAEALADMISYILINWVIATIGKIILLLFNLVVGWLAPYNNFIDSAAVVTGWVLTRDMANMFFILVLLAIAFGTILKIEQLNYQRILPKLLIMAVVINFSKTLCGLVIDFGQVVMLTFVNAFMSAAGGNFLNALGLTKLMQLSQNTTLDFGSWEVAAAALFGTIMMGVTLMVVVVYVIVLAYRIVMLWILVILSPLAFLAGGFPIGKASAAYGQWWDNFVGAVLIGPVLAFFLWLALLTAGGGTLGQDFINTQYTAPTSEEQISGSLTENYFITEGGTSESTVGFIIAIALLLAGLAVAQQVGGELGGVAGQWAGKTKGFMAGALTGAAVGASKLGVGAARKTAGWTDRQLGVREKLYGGMAKVPGLKQLGYTQLAKTRHERAQKTGELAKVVSSLAPAEVENLLKGRAMTADQKELQMLGHKQALSSGHAGFLAKQGKSKPEILAEQAKHLDVFTSMAKERGDVEMMKFAGEYKDKNPHLILDSKAKANAYKDASSEDRKKWSSDAWRDTEGLAALAEKERQTPGIISEVLNKAGGEPSKLFNKFMDDYPAGAAMPGAGIFTMDKGFQPAVLTGAQAFGAKAAGVILEDLMKARDSKLNFIAREGYNPATNVFNPDVLRSSMKIQAEGGNAEQAFGADRKTGQFINDQFGASFGAALLEAKADTIGSIGEFQTLSEAQVAGGKFILGIDDQALKVKDGDYREKVINNIDVDNLVTATEVAERENIPGGMEKIKSLLKEFQSEAQTIRSSGSVSDKEQIILDKIDKMTNNDTLRRAMGK
ncbi:MAG: hypothetical protein PHW53_02390 [Patescibacteria group bacterium]|nr:hypothetical protein [Patescibacteria group bacterium]